MSTGRWYERPLARTAAILALLAYLPALTAAPGRMPSDSKLYLYLDPGRFFGDAASTFDGRQFAGWVPHQHIAYLWPTTPWFWMFETLGVPDWIAHRLWIGTILLAAGLGVRWCARLLGLGPMAAFVAALVYQLSVYVLPYISRTSVMLLPWAGLGWIVAFTIRATRRQSWADPAAIALIVLTVGAVNATALAMIVPAPLLWLVHAAWSGSLSWRRAAVVALRTAALSLAVSMWWIAMLVIQGRHGVDVLPYSESLGDVSLTATSAEAWRGLGYWLFYVRDPYAATTTESLRYLSSTWSIVVSYALPLLALLALAGCRWTHRRFAALLIAVGLVLAVGVHPIDDRSPLMRLLAGDDDSGLALALRSSTRALPVTMLGLALALAMATDASRGITLPRPRVPASWAVGAAIALIAVVNLPSLWTGAFVDPALERDQDPPEAWIGAAAALDAAGDEARVLQLPGAEFGAYRWGYTVDQPLPGLTEKPLVTRDLLPLGSPGAMDLLYALDDRIQDGVLEPASLAPIAQLLGADTVWITNDAAFDRFRTARPEAVRDLVTRAPGVGPLDQYGDPVVNRPDVPMVDERALADPRIGTAAPPVELAPIAAPGAVVRAASDVVVVSGSGDGLVDVAAAGLLDPSRTVIRYSADVARGDGGPIDRAPVAVVVTDSNRDRARHWRSSQDTTGYTEPGGPEQDVLRPTAADARLDVFERTDGESQTIATQEGPVVATATAYGEPFAHLPEHRPAMAVDGDRSTAWLVGEHGDPIGEMLRLEFDAPVSEFTLHQPAPGDDRRITRISYSTDGGGPTFADLSPASWEGPGQTMVTDGSFTELEITIDEVSGGVPFTGSAVAGVGFSEVETALGPSVEIVRPPIDAADLVHADTSLAYVLTRLRTDPMDRWRDDPEPVLRREIAVPDERTFALGLTGRVDQRASDAELAELFDWQVVASSRLIGSPRNAGVAAFDDDPETAWVSGFADASGATITAAADQPVSRVEIVQPDGEFSTITAVTLRAGGTERTITLAPDASGTSLVELEPALPPGPIEFVVAGVEDRSTTDRRFGDPVALPAAISELRFDGRPVTAPFTETAVETDCTPVATIDGTAVNAVVRISGAGWADGEPVELDPCGSAGGTTGVALGAGLHRIEALATESPVTIDRIVLDDGVRATIADAAPGAFAEVVSKSAFDRSIRVDECSDGCWLVLGEGFNDAWTATGPGGDLGPPSQVDGGFNGWWVDPVDEPVVIDVRWTAQRPLNWALALTALAALVATALIVMERRRADPAAEVERPGLARPTWSLPSSSEPIGQRTVLVAAGSWIVLAALVISPEWAVAGAVGGLGLWLLRHRRTAELTAAACLSVVAVVVTVRERRTAPPPNGGWPSTFESLHGLGMFAIVCVLVAAIIADDARAELPVDDSTDQPVDRRGDG